MRQRCLNPNNSRYSEWGGRGITVCERWASFDNFLADMGEVPSPQHTLDRLDPDGNYEPDNCRWATRSEQQRNRRDSRKLTFKERTQSIYDWAEETGLPAYVIRNRTKAGWPVEAILTTPLKSESSRTGRPITFRGVTKSGSEWAKETGIPQPTISWRLRRGWPIAKVLGRSNTN